MGTIVTALASARDAVHRPATGPLTDASLERWANEDYPTWRRRLADDVPDLFTKVTADIPVAEGVTTFDLTAAPASLTDFEKLRGLELKSGTSYLPLLWAPPLASTVSTGLAGTYRAKYVTKAASLVVASSTALDWPAGMDRVLVESLAARVRRRFNEDPKWHMDEAERVYRDIRDGLMRQYLSTPQTIVDVSGMVQWPRFRFRGPATVELVGGW